MHSMRPRSGVDSRYGVASQRIKKHITVDQEQSYMINFRDYSSKIGYAIGEQRQT